MLKKVFRAFAVDVSSEVYSEDVVDSLQILKGGTWEIYNKEIHESPEVWEQITFGCGLPDFCYPAVQVEERSC